MQPDQAIKIKEIKTKTKHHFQNQH